MTSVLNPTLYRKLQRRFGPVKVANPGQAMVFRTTRDIMNEPRLDIVQSGEQYRLCCRYCHDTCFRLYVSHRWGQRDDFGRRMTFLAKCFNEDCLTRPEKREDFIERLEEVTSELEEALVRPGMCLPEEARQVSWPGPCKPLDKLRKRHPARIYLQSRGFDPDLLARRYQVCYCTESHYYLAKDRLIIPIFERGKLMGFQARYIGELPWKDPEKKRSLPPKYFSCPNNRFRSQCVYNWDRMKQWEAGVIVEGPTDVWRFGAMAGCFFGNVLTEAQWRKLLAVFRKRSLVLLLDPEEFGSRGTVHTVEEFELRMPGRFCAIKLPQGTDPGSLERDFLRDYVKQQAKEQGVTVKYRKCK